MLETPAALKFRSGAGAVLGVRFHPEWDRIGEGDTQPTVIIGRQRFVPSASRAPWSAS